MMLGESPNPFRLYGLSGVGELIRDMRSVSSQTRALAWHPERICSHWDP